MAKPHKKNQGEEILLAGGLAVGGYFLWKHFQGQAAAASAATAAASTPIASVAGQNVAITPLTPPASSTAATSSTSSSAAGTVATIIPAVPLNSPPTNVGSVNGTQIVEETPLWSSYGVSLPSNFATQNDPTTGLQPPTDIVPAVSTATVIAVPGTTGLQAPADVCGEGGVFPGNNPSGANGGATYPTVMAGLMAGFTQLDVLANQLGPSFTISGIAAYWVGDLHSGGTGTGANQLAFEASMVALTGLNDYSLEPSDPATMLKLMRGIIGTVSGAQYYGAFTDACLLQAYNGT
jgi:hypothetical protein